MGEKPRPCEMTEFDNFLKPIIKIIKIIKILFDMSKVLFQGLYTLKCAEILPSTLLDHKKASGLRMFRMPVHNKLLKAFQLLLAFGVVAQQLFENGLVLGWDCFAVGGLCHDHFQLGFQLVGLEEGFAS
jgi:hypothetical protein